MCVPWFPVGTDRMSRKLAIHKYKVVDEVKRDFDLLVSNAIKFNGEDSSFGEFALELQDMFEAGIATVRNPNSLWLGHSSSCIHATHVFGHF